MVWVFVPCCVISCPSSCFPSLVISFTCPWWATCVISLQVFPLSAFGPCTILVFVFGLKLSFSFSSCLSACLAIGSSLFDIRDSKRRSKRDTDVEGDSNGEKTGVLFSVIWRDPAALCLIFFSQFSAWDASPTQNICIWLPGNDTQQSNYLCGTFTHGSDKSCWFYLLKNV